MDDGKVEDVDEAEDDGNADSAGSSKPKRRRRRQYKIHLKAIANNFANGSKKLKERSLLEALERWERRGARGKEG